MKELIAITAVALAGCAAPEPRQFPAEHCSGKLVVSYKYYPNGNITDVTISCMIPTHVLQENNTN